jgi:hypothetical protein
MDEKKPGLYRNGGYQTYTVDHSEKDKGPDSIINENFIRGFFNVGSNHRVNNIEYQFKY